jgi:eukaryotic-like serine/threonine-protein kinase
MPSITDSIGRVLGDRYRLITALGTGASAHVFLAEDVSLHRQVAIKVLHPALAADAAFLKRFRAEARAVAALNHPNILQVYDWGEEDGEPYLVLEFLAGGSLRQIFDTGVLLSQAQAVQVGIEAAAGLDYAHRRGLIHRDIKPANLLFDADGRLRIADFGLARALAEASWTEPEGAMLGTARYAAPEQGSGNWVLDGKADVYSLALVLYEAVTGESPFIGDTTVTTLMARVGALLPEHYALGPLNDILVWAAAPEVAERYDAAQFGVRLRALAGDLADPAPLPIVGAAPVTPPGPGTGTVNGNGNGAGNGAARSSDVTDRTALTRDLTAIGAPEVVADGPGKGRGAAKAAKARPSSSTSGRQPTARPKTTGRRRLLWVVATLLVAAAILLVVLATDGQLVTPRHAVPELVGKPLPAARAAARPGGFTVKLVGTTPSVTVARGGIVSQVPIAERNGHHVSAQQGSTVRVVVSSGPPPVAIPDVTTFTDCHDAVQALAAVHLVGTCPVAAEQYSSTVPAGGVLGTSPTASALYGSAVTVVLSKGHAPVVIPAVTGPTSTFATAQAALVAAGFTATQATAYSPTVPAGQVIGTTPPATAGPQPFGSAVTVTVSKGPQPVLIPNVVGQSVAAATRALQGLGLTVAGPYGPPGSSTVLSTDPAAGASVQPGTTVNIYTL